MYLNEKIKSIYPELTEDDFVSTIVLTKELDSEEVITSWNHPTLAKPTQEQLDAVGGEA